MDRNAEVEPAFKESQQNTLQTLRSLAGRHILREGDCGTMANQSRVNSMDEEDTTYPDEEHSGSETRIWQREDHAESRLMLPLS